MPRLSSRLAGLFGTLVFAITTAGPGSAQASGDSSTPIAQLALELDLEIGSVDGVEDAFTRVGRLLPRADGSVLVVDNAEATILEFDAEGRRIRRMGRRGEGPGEFFVPSRVGWWGHEGAFWVTDIFESRLTVFCPTGEVSHTRPLRLDGRRTVNWEEIDFHLFPDTTVLALDLRAPMGGTWSLSLARADTDSTSTRLLSLDRTERSVPIPNLTPNSGGSLRDPIPDGPMVRFSPWGDFVFVVTRDEPTSSSEARATVRAVRPNGGVAWTASRPRPVIPVPEPLRDSLVGHWQERFRNSALYEGVRPSRLDAFVEELLDLPAYHPPIVAAVASGDGGIWLVWHPEGSTAEATVFDAAGRETATVSIPAMTAAGLAAVEGEFAWSIEEGPFEVPLVRRFRIVER